MAKKIQSLKLKLLKLLDKKDIARAGIFGSYARGEQKKNSDIDILIQFKGRKSLFDLSKLELELEKKLGRKVDLITYNSIHPLIKNQILGEEVKVI